MDVLYVASRVMFVVPTCGSYLVMSYLSQFGFEGPQNVASVGSMNISIPHRACHHRVYVVIMCLWLLVHDSVCTGYVEMFSVLST